MKYQKVLFKNSFMAILLTYDRNRKRQCHNERHYFISYNPKTPQEISGSDAGNLSYGKHTLLGFFMGVTK